MTTELPTVIGLGRLVDFVILDADGKRIRVTPEGKCWLAWKPDTLDLVVLRPGNGKSAEVDRISARRHQRFHGAAPKEAQLMEWPEQCGSMHTVGLIESVTYTATGIRSPSKGSHHWIHQFGDHGELGHASMRRKEGANYDRELFPRLDIDGIGSLTIVRRKGNRYRVSGWIIH